MLPSVPLPSKIQLLEAAPAYFSLFLTLGTALWPKFVHFVEMIAAPDLRRWVWNLFEFTRRVRRRLRSVPRPRSPWLKRSFSRRLAAASNGDSA